MQGFTSNHNQDKNKEIKQLVQGLCEQVRLDQDFRNAKIWYEYNHDANKEQ